MKSGSLFDDVLDPTATTAYTNQDVDESTESNVGQRLETGPAISQLSYPLSGGSPWKVLDTGRWRIFHHPEFPASSSIDVERIQGLSGKTETISNVIIDELDSLAKRTQVIILSPTREAAQATHTLVSASAAASSIATHLSVGGNDIHKDRQRLKERPHVVIGTIGRIFSMLERKTINPCDIKFFCVEGIQYFLGTNYETQFAEFCEKLPKDTEVVFLSTKTRYKTPHDFSRFFTNQPLHFLVKEDPAPEPGATPCDLEPVGVGLSQSEETMQNAIKPPQKQRFCALCPELPAFIDKAALGQHRKERHNTPCPVCYMPTYSPRHLAKHLKKAHGIVNNDTQAADQTVLETTDNRVPAESPRTNSLPLTSGELEEPSRPTSTPHQDSGDSVLPGVRDTSLGRFYCEECGYRKGFPSKAFLESHTRFFHPKKPSQSSGGEKVATTLSNDVPEATEKSAEHSPAYFSPTIGSPRSGERAIPDGPDPPTPSETPVPVLPQEQREDTHLDVGKYLQQTFESLPEPSVTTQSDVDVPPAVTASTPLSLLCRICGAPPTVGTRPTATVCGHLFCSECITQYVMSTSRCPVCNNALLLYCLFKLDLPVSP